MNLTLATRLQSSAYDLGISAEIRNGYSGRGMNGKTTVGLVIADALSIAAIAVHAADGMRDQGMVAEVDGMVRELSRLRMDDMGRDCIIY